MTVIKAIFLGLIQGIAEFLPVSSSGHLSIVQNLFKFEYSEDGHLLFDVLLHLGTLVSICVLYRSELRAIISDSVDFLRKRFDGEEDEPVLKPTVRMLVLVIAGTIPLILALIFSKSIEKLFYMTGFIGFALIMTGAILFVADRLIKKGSKSERTMTIMDAVVIGLAQAVAVIPGLSRSGTTISVGMSRGLDRDFAVKFSLLLSLPAVLGSTIVTLFSALRKGIDLKLLPIYLAGFVVAAVIGCASILLLRRLMAKGKFGSFAYYCWAAGALTIILSIVL